MGVKIIVKTTANRGEFNRAYKKYLEVSKGKICCSRCRYHHGENDVNNWYGGYYGEKINNLKVRYPNWKLVSKHNKQWMKKPVKIIYDTNKLSKRIYVEIKFPI